MNSPLLVVNAGSSSIKFALFHTNETNSLVAGVASQVEGIGTEPRFTVKDAAGQPLVDRALPAGDVAHHASALAFALPQRLAKEGVRRYGFHGPSYEYIASTLPTLGPELAGGRVIVAHLGNGASLCALQGGRSVATTMGFTPLDGLVMGKRCGNLDPGALLYLMDRHGLDARALEKSLCMNPACLGSPAFRTTCGRCWPATTRAPGRRSTCLSTVPGGRSARLPRRWAAWMPSSSPQESGKVRP